MSDGFDFAGKTALVTGSSRGIGAGVVRGLARGGARCILNYYPDAEGRNFAEAQKVAAEASAALIIAADVGEPEQVAAMMERIAKEAGGLDILINNAGILADRSIKKMTRQEWDNVLRVNLTGAFNCIQHGANILRPGGRIVNMSSVSGQLGFFGQANYAAAKAGIAALTKVAARELARQNILVNAVAPGFVRTEMTRSMPASVAAQFVAQVPLGRFAEIDEIVDVVLFLCAHASRFMTGQVLHVNGGLFMDS